MRELLPGLTLVGFETLPGETVRSGAQVGASLIWQAGDSPLAADWDMSLSAASENGKNEWLLTEPAALAGDGYPTSRWQPGEMLRGQLLARTRPRWNRACTN